MRQLFIAIDKYNKKYNIDNLKKENIPNQLYCPYCKREVIPKIGTKKIPHFAHKTSECNIEKSKQEQLKEFNIIINEEYFKKIESDLFMCPICKSTVKKEYGIKLDERRYICKNCITRLKELKDI